MSFISSAIWLVIGFAIGYYLPRLKGVLLNARDVGLNKIMTTYNIPRDKVYKEVKP